MKQYCRYCLYATASCDDYNIVWCDKYQKKMLRESAKKVNKCKNFNFCKVDCFNPKKLYKPREKTVKGDKGTQNTLEVKK